ncbi:hypothetical protein N0V83_007258 [Neocucurbitaria cava]|uniref:N-terminal nucleophile aminohydrolase n=1 Tax=Neocucurbitaria cava TaxID=798079 RepID=A0A9W8Y521_9PLEO|nr:hypothetical protein N0V83_007258 [Neocucurbitaria cava]
MAAKERWARWRIDLKSAERKSRKAGDSPSTWRMRNDLTPEDEAEQQRMREQHTRNLLRGYPSLPSSPSAVSEDEHNYYPTNVTSNSHSDLSLPLFEQSSSSWPSDDKMATSDTSTYSPVSEDVRPHTVADSSRNAFINSTQKVPTVSQYREYRTPPNFTPHFIEEDTPMGHSDRGQVYTASGRRSWGDGSEEGSDSPSSTKTMKAEFVEPSFPATVNTPLAETQNLGNIEKEPTPLPPRPAGPRPLQLEGDNITDTVGAIAVDSLGNIACGASSGGIGMKYRGRVGPAALVGVGAAVIPVDPDDPEQMCVATVTSGTGEHMATTMAATVCAERLYQSVKKSRGGEYVEVTEDEALRAMIESEFMG